MSKYFLVASVDGKAVRIEPAPMRGAEKMDRQRRLVQAAFPHSKVFSPMEKSPIGAMVVAVFGSPNNDGIGRQGTSVYLWAVAPDCHDVGVYTTRDDDGIWLRCDCGWEHNAGYGPSVDFLVSLQKRHRELARQSVTKGG